MFATSREELLDSFSHLCSTKNIAFNKKYNWNIGHFLKVMQINGKKDKTCLSDIIKYIVLCALLYFLLLVSYRKSKMHIQLKFIRIDSAQMLGRLLSSLIKVNKKCS